MQAQPSIARAIILSQVRAWWWYSLASAMTRALSSTCRALALWIAVAIVLVAGGSIAHAGKQKVAVLTLEVVGNPDPEHLKLAKTLSAELRERVRNSNDFTLVGGDKDLVDEKLMNGCANEAPACMAPIGAKLEAELLMYGKMDRSQKGFQITIRLLRIANRQYVSTWPDDIALKRITDEPKVIAKLAFSKLMPNQTGTLVVKISNVDRATLYIDGKPEGTLASGLYSSTLQPGRYKVGIEAAEKGWMRYEETITVRAGESTPVSAELTRIKATPLDEPARAKKPPPSELTHETGGTVSQQTSKRTGWKVLAAGGLITSAVSGGVWIWSYAKPINGYQGLLDDHHGATSNGMELDSRDCGKTPDADSPNRDKFQDACRARTYTKIAAPITIAAGLVGAGALIYVLLKDDKATEQRPVGAGRRTKKRSLAVTPVVSPDGAGATVRFDW
jgi:TolB-like protein